MGTVWRIRRLKQIKRYNLKRNYYKKKFSREEKQK
jgi:hypothetical protein